MSANSHDHLVKARLSFLDVRGAGALGQAGELAAVLGVDAPPTNLVADLGLSHITGERLAFDNAMFMHYEDLTTPIATLAGIVVCHRSCPLGGGGRHPIGGHPRAIPRGLDLRHRGDGRLDERSTLPCTKVECTPRASSGFPLPSAAVAHLTGLCLDETVSAVAPRCRCGRSERELWVGREVVPGRVRGPVRPPGGDTCGVGVRADFTSIVNGLKGVLAVGGSRTATAGGGHTRRGRRCRRGQPPGGDHRAVRCVRQHALLDRCGSRSAPARSGAGGTARRPGSVRVSIHAARRGHVERPARSSPWRPSSACSSRPRMLREGDVPLTAYTPTGYVDPAVRALMSAIGRGVRRWWRRGVQPGIAHRPRGRWRRRRACPADGRCPHLGDMLASERVKRSSCTTAPH